MSALKVVIREDMSAKCDPLSDQSLVNEVVAIRGALCNQAVAPVDDKHAGEQFHC